MWQYSIQRHQDNDYDLIITILPENVEFGSDYFQQNEKKVCNDPSNPFYHKQRNSKSKL